MDKIDQIYIFKKAMKPNEEVGNHITDQINKIMKWIALTHKIKTAPKRSVQVVALKKKKPLEKEVCGVAREDGTGIFHVNYIFTTTFQRFQ